MIIVRSKIWLIIIGRNNMEIEVVSINIKLLIENIRNIDFSLSLVDFYLFLKPLFSFFYTASKIFKFKQLGIGYYNIELIIFSGFKIV